MKKLYKIKINYNPKINDNHAKVKKKTNPCSYVYPKRKSSENNKVSSMNNKNATFRNCS